MLDASYTVLVSPTVLGFPFHNVRPLFTPHWPWVLCTRDGSFLLSNCELETCIVIVPTFLDYYSQKRKFLQWVRLQFLETSSLCFICLIVYLSDLK